MTEYHDLEYYANLAIAGNTEAYPYIYNLTYQKIYKTAYDMLGNKNDAQDAMHDVYVKIFTNITNLNYGKYFMSWIITITVNHCINLSKRKKFHVYDDNSTMEIYHNMIDEESYKMFEDIEQKEINNILLKFIETLAPEQKNVILLHYYGGLKAREIADIENCSVSTITSRLLYARGALKQLILDYEKNNDTKLYSAGLISVFNAALPNTPSILSAVMALEIFISIMKTLDITVPSVDIVLVPPEENYEKNKSLTIKGKFNRLLKSHYIFKVRYPIIVLLLLIGVSGYFAITYNKPNTIIIEPDNEIITEDNAEADNIIYTDSIILEEELAIELEYITVTTNSELQAIIESGSEAIFIEGSIEINSPLVITKNTVIKGGELYRADGYSGNLLILQSQKNKTNGYELTLIDTIINGKCYDEENKKYIQNFNSMIIIEEFSSLILDGAQIINNYFKTGTDKNHGGAIIAHSFSSILVKGETIIRNNRSKDYGGAIYLDSYAKLTIESGTIKSNWSTNGGAIYCKSGEIYINGGVICDNYVGGKGGGIGINSGYIEINDGEFYNNLATYIGGFINLEYSQFSFNGGDAYGNQSVVDGACFKMYKSNGIFNAGVIHNNNATNIGAGFFASDGYIEINGTEFIDNIADKGGGIIALENCELIINSGKFNGNAAIDGDGGVFWLKNSNLIINDGDFMNNSSAYNGGVIYGSASNVTISGGHMSKNIAIRGSVAYFKNDEYEKEKCILSVTGGIFNENIAKDKGGFYIDRSDMRINGGEIYDNKATQTSGGIILNRRGQLDITGGILRDNKVYLNTIDIEATNPESDDSIIINRD